MAKRCIALKAQKDCGTNCKDRLSELVKFNPLKAGRLPDQAKAKGLREKVDKIKGKLKDVVKKKEKKAANSTDAKRRLQTTGVEMTPSDAGVDLVNEGNNSGVDTSGLVLVLTNIVSLIAFLF